MTEMPLERVELLIGKEGLEALQQACVMVVGIGGVGGYAAEALARSGIGKLILVDADTIAPSNLNRQIHALTSTLGQPKTEVMKQRIHSYAPACDVIAVQKFFDESSAELFAEKIDFVVDAIDTLTSKLALIAMARRFGVPTISSLGMANRFDPTQLHDTTLDKTSYDPLARALRQMARKQGLDLRIPVIWSSEIPLTQNRLVNEQGATLKQKYPPASTVFVPAAAGLACASHVFRKILEMSQNAGPLPNTDRDSEVPKGR